MDELFARLFLFLRAKFLARVELVKLERKSFGDAKYYVSTMVGY